MTGSAGRPGRAVALSPAYYREALSALASERFDVLVVGGGIVGAGTALDAATRGLRVALVEAQDFAAGTSSRSSKLVHGGLRYLQMHDFALVREALRERAVLFRIAPHLVRPVPILYPLRHRVVERAYVTAGVLLYDLFAHSGRRGAGLPFHRQVSRARMRAIAPALSPKAVGAVLYYDGQVDDARYVLSVVRTAAANGAVVANRVRATGLLREGRRVVGVRAVQVESGAEIDVRADAVVSATGAWTESFESLTGGREVMRLQPAKGVHLVVPRGRIEASTALILPTSSSVLFVLPWGDHWVIGTTDTPWEHDLARPAANAGDIDYLLRTVNEALSKPLDRSDVESVFVGIRPLIAGTSSETTKLSREHAVDAPVPGLTLVSGGKYTTYRLMAEDVVDAALRDRRGAPPSRTEGVPILGSDGYEDGLAAVPALAADHGLAPDEVRRLLGRYGGLLGEVLEPARADPSLLGTVGASSGYLWAEVVYAVTHEGARHLEDVLSLRTRISIETRDRGSELASAVAGVMATHLGWGRADVEREVDAYRRLVAAELAAEGERDDAGAAAAMATARPLLPGP
ncbi:MAG: glycerol-3-phosphate dehydrogenase/oxidase [Actinomycetota bacterium]|nr:glycerol-3-phosphate dehydrogenase/oxidase [Actinomycetota bacterium]